MKTIQVKIVLTEAQAAVLDQLCGDLDEERAYTRSETIRYALMSMARQNSLQWPNDPLKWGGLRKGAFGKTEEK